MPSGTTHHLTDVKNTTTEKKPQSFVQLYIYSSLRRDRYVHMCLASYTSDITKVLKDKCLRLVSPLGQKREEVDSVFQFQSAVSYF